jgi:phenylalanyl-tRNA synthetase beta chain
MKVPLSWLKDYLKLELSPQQIADTLTLAGLEVEKIDMPEISFEGVVVARVIAAVPHPNADKLRVATVFDGTENFQVVCGAPNCREGMKTALARIGASLKDADGKAWKIKRSKLRDVESFGMLCASEELGLPGDSEGIIELSEDLVEGTDLGTLYADPVLDISLTPNLGHCMSLIGIARELGALLRLKYTKPAVELREDSSQSIEKMIDVAIEDPQQCLRYSCCVLTGVKVGPSPAWLKNRLEACGIRSVNNLVDVGNYVLLEYGQPLHIFDYDKIADKKIRVSSKTDRSTLAVLDGQELKIPKDTLLICDGKGPVAFAGVIGGSDSAVSESTHNILIESAYFTPEAVRKTSKLLSLRTEASQRFEKGIDPAATVEALKRAAALIVEVAGGCAVKGILDKGQTSFEPPAILCRLSRVNQMLGTLLSLGEVADILERLEIRVSPEGQESLRCIPPTYRNDLKTEIDLIEEVGRLYGYNNIPKIIPRHITSSLPHAPMFVFEQEVRAQLRGLGLQEFLTCDLISPFQAQLTCENTLPPDAFIPVLHPSSVDQSILRASLLPGLLQVMKYNQDRGIQDISGFEVGRIHFKNGGSYVEQTTAAVILMGSSRPYHFDPKPQEVDFFDLKGYVENLLQTLGVQDVTFEISHFHNFHPGRQARVKAGTTLLGVMGEVHPSHLHKLGIQERVLFAELNLHDLYPLRKTDWTTAQIPLYPGSERDWTLTLRDEALIGQVLEIMRSVPSRLLEKIMLLDLYKSEQIGKDRKNATFRFAYRDLEKTISMETIEREHARVTQLVAEKLKGSLC